MRRFLRVAWFVLTGLLLPALPVASQVKLGEISTNLSGTIATRIYHRLRKYSRIRSRLDGWRHGYSYWVLPQS